MNLFSKLKSDDGINYLNIILMLVSCALAFLLPFELFLFAYSVLGPLHYLTEISWLQNKNYFVKSKRDIVLFVFMAILLLIALLNSKSKLGLHSGTIFFISFLFAYIILFVEKTTSKLLWLLISFFLFAVFGLYKVPFINIVFAILLPTIIHVFVFTGAFILLGALKSKSVSGIISLVVFLLCAASYFIFTPEGLNYHASEYVQKTYNMFAILNKTLSYILGVGTINTIEDVFNNQGAIAIMRFIAFAYTYHYLNWFSKTSVIKWHQISKIRMIGILILWIFSVLLYAYDYKTGFYALFFLSVLHVFLEFPLNYISFINIGKELKLRVKKSK